MERRKMLEISPTPSVNDSVNFDTSDIPWWAWVRRFHLPVVSTLLNINLNSTGCAWYWWKLQFILLCLAVYVQHAVC